MNGFLNSFIMKSLSRLFVSVCLMLATDLFAQISDSSDPTDDLLPSIESFFQRTARQHQEKLWLHLDKPYYGAGDKIWFKAYLVDATEHRTDTLSNFIYVDIVDRKGKTVLTKKIKRDSCGFANNFEIPHVFPAGDYTLRAYTGWMTNFDPAFFFQRNIRIGNSLSGRVNAAVTYTDPKNGTPQAIVRFTGPDSEPYPDVNVRFEVFDRNGKRISGAQQKTTVTGAVFVDLPPDSIRQGGYVSTAIDQGELFFKKEFFFPEDSVRVAVKFMPEGGDLVPGVPQIVAFRAERSDARTAEVEGVVTTKDGDTVARFASEHDGMGSFLIIPKTGERYVATVAARTGDTLRVELPEVDDDGYALAAVQTPDEVRYRVNRDPDKEFEPMTVVAHVRGKCIGIQNLNPMNPTGRWKTDSIPEGILHLVLIDSSLRTRSERILFVAHPHDRERWEAASDKPRYEPRQKVVIRIRLTAADSTPLGADCSVSVTDRKTVATDSLGEDIRANLLMTSDIRGYVRNPGYYFRDESPATRHHRDLLMRTRGWRRFDFAKIADTAAFRPERFCEHGQFIAGHVTGMMGKDAPLARVTAVALNRENVFGTAVADERGNFLIDGLDFRDTTLFMVTAKTRRGKPVQAVAIEESYPRPAFLRKNPFEPETEKNAMNRYLENTKKGLLDLNGEKVYELPGAVVRAVDPRKPKANSYGTLYDTTALAKYKPMSLYNYIVFLPSVVRVGGDLFVKRKGLPIPQELAFDMFYAPVSLSLNGKGCALSDLTDYTVDDVLYINHIHKTETAMIGEYPYHIEIILKEGVSAIRSEIKMYRTIGYAESVEFYSPIYDTPEKIADEKPDIRTTLYWNPYLQIGPDGTAQIEFYSNDHKNQQYDIAIEGITPDGKTCRYRKDISAR